MRGPHRGGAGSPAHLVAEGLDLAVGALHDGRVRVPVVVVRVDLHVQRQALRGKLG